MRTKIVVIVVALVTGLLCASGVYAQVTSYEGDVLPSAATPAWAVYAA